MSDDKGHGNMCLETEERTPVVELFCILFPPPTPISQSTLTTFGVHQLGRPIQTFYFYTFGQT